MTEGRLLVAFKLSAINAPVIRILVVGIISSAWRVQIAAIRGSVEHKAGGASALSIVTGYSFKRNSDVS